MTYTPDQKEEYKEENNKKLKPHGLRLVERSWYFVLVGLAVIAVASLTVLAVFAYQGKFQSVITQSITPVYNASITADNHYNPTTTNNNQYDFKPVIINNVTIPLEVRCVIANST